MIGFGYSKRRKTDSFSQPSGSACPEPGSAEDPSSSLETVEMPPTQSSPAEVETTAMTPPFQSSSSDIETVECDVPNLISSPLSALVPPTTPQSPGLAYSADSINRYDSSIVGNSDSEGEEAGVCIDMYDDIGLIAFHAFVIYRLKKNTPC